MVVASYPITVARTGKTTTMRETHIFTYEVVPSDATWIDSFATVWDRRVQAMSTLGDQAIAVRLDSKMA